MATNNSEKSSASQNNMATNQRIPSIVKFRGDNKLSFLQWILQFGAQLKALNIRDIEVLSKNFLLCCT